MIRDCLVHIKNIILFNDLFYQKKAHIIILITDVMFRRYERKMVKMFLQNNSALYSEWDNSM